MLKTATFSSESRLHETAAHGRVLEFVLTGAIPHARPDSAGLARRAGDELKNEIARHQPRAVVVNLLDFDPSFGNEIGTLFLTTYMALAHSGGGEMAILAAGQTAIELDNFLKAGHLDSMYGTTHRDLGSALAKMTKTLSVPKASVPTEAKAESEATRRLEHGKEAPDIPLEEICPHCGRNLVIRNSDHGDFVVCAGYLKGCMYVAANLAAEPHGLKCPQCKEGEIVKKKKPRGSFGCSRYPQCKFTSAGQPPMSIAEKAGIVLAIIFMAMLIAAMAVLLGTALAFGGILRWVCLGVVLAAVAALLGGGRGGFLHHELELQFLIFVALLIAAVVVPLAARGAPLALLWLIPGGSLLLILALLLGDRVLEYRQREGATEKAHMLPAKGLSISKEEVAGISFLVLLCVAATGAVVVLVAAWAAPRGGWWVDLFSILAVTVLVGAVVARKLMPPAAEFSERKQEAPVVPPSPQEGELRPPMQPGPQFLREKNGAAILQVSGRRFEFGDASLFENRFAALLQGGRKQVIIDLSQVTFIGATGVGALVRAFLQARKTGAAIKLVASPNVQKVLEGTRLATVFDTYSDEDSALSAFR
jgi:anti-anti-sigma factor